MGIKLNLCLLIGCRNNPPGLMLDCRLCVMLHDDEDDDDSSVDQECLSCNNILHYDFYLLSVFVLTPVLVQVASHLMTL